MNWKDVAERMIWLALIGVITSLSSATLFDIEAWKAAAQAGVQQVLGFLVLVGQSRLKALPDPGAAVREQALEDVALLARPKRAAKKP